MTVDSWVLSAVRLVARLYFVLLAVGLAVLAAAAVGKIGQSLAGEPTSYVFELGYDHPPLADSARMVEGTPLVTGHDSPRLGSVLAELPQLLPTLYGAVVIGLALRALDLARERGLFCDGLPHRVGLLGWALAGQPVWALVEATTTAYLRSHVLAAATVGGELGPAFGAALEWSTVAVGVGVLLLRSIIVEGVGMRRELDGTV